MHLINVLQAINQIATNSRCGDRPRTIHIMGCKRDFGKKLLLALKQYLWTKTIRFQDYWPCKNENILLENLFCFKICDFEKIGEES